MSDYLEADFQLEGKRRLWVEGESQWQVKMAELMGADSVGVHFNLCLSSSGTLVFSCHHRERRSDEAVARSGSHICWLKRTSCRHFCLKVTRGDGFKFRVWAPATKRDTLGLKINLPLFKVLKIHLVPTTPAHWTTSYWSSLQSFWIQTQFYRRIKTDIIASADQFVSMLSIFLFSTLNIYLHAIKINYCISITWAYRFWISCKVLYRSLSCNRHTISCLTKLAFACMSRCQI